MLDGGVCNIYLPEHAQYLEQRTGVLQARVYARGNADQTTNRETISTCNKRDIWYRETITPSRCGICWIAVEVGSS